MPNEICSGHLEKWTNYFRGFQLRWFVLTDENLSYYQNKEIVESACKGYISLKRLSIRKINANNLKLMVDNNAFFYLRHKNSKVIKSWHVAILGAIKAIRPDITQNSLTAGENNGQNFADFGEQIPADQQTLNTELFDTISVNSNNREVLKSMITEHSDSIKLLCSFLNKQKEPLFTIFDDFVIDNDQLKINEKLFIKELKLDVSNIIEGISCAAENVSKAVNEFQIIFEKYQKCVEDDLENKNINNRYLQDNLKKLALECTKMENMAEKFTEEDLSRNSELVDSTMSDDFFDALSDEEVDVVNCPKDDNINSKIDIHIQTSLNVKEKAESDTTHQLFPNHQNAQSCVNLHESYKDHLPCPKSKNYHNRTISNEEIYLTVNSSYRKTIPPKPNVKLDIWGFIKNSIGKDITKISMPVNFNEPLSLLQRVTEVLNHSSLLDQAAAESDPLLRLVYIAAFSVSCYSTNYHRTTKPFNPLLNETYECDRTSDYGWRSICEQVSHHPPMCALHAEGKSWVYTENFSMKSKFGAKSLSVTPLGLAQFRLAGSDETYSWSKVTTTVNNLIIGTLSIDQTGTCEIVNNKTGDMCVLTFHAQRFFSKSDRRKVTGSVVDKDGVARYYIHGYWNSSVMYSKIDPTKNIENLEDLPSKVVWNIETLPEDAQKRYNFTEFTCSLNEINDDNIAKTDSRFRMDQRYMEQGDFENANKYKTLLEVKQRSRRKAALEEFRKNEGGTHCSGFTEEVIQPVWFEFDKENSSENKIVYKYKGNYWSSKKRKDWSACPNIFDVDE